MHKELTYYDIIMKANQSDINELSICTLPDGYKYKMYEDGDEKYWCELETKVGEFDNINLAHDYFNRVFMPYKSILNQRMIFITYDDNIVATASAWFKDSDSMHFPLLHWVSTDPIHQGKGLAKAAVIYALKKICELDSNDAIYLHTQTWSYDAVGLYVKLGFKITDEPLIDTVTDFKCLAEMKPYLRDDIYQLLIRK